MTFALSEALSVDTAINRMFTKANVNYFSISVKNKSFCDSKSHPRKTPDD